jgi:hypothetical protein
MVRTLALTLLVYRLLPYFSLVPLLANRNLNFIEIGHAHDSFLVRRPQGWLDPALKSSCYRPSRSAYPEHHQPSEYAHSCPPGVKWAIMFHDSLATTNQVALLNQDNELSLQHFQKNGARLFSSNQNDFEVLQLRELDEGTNPSSVNDHVEIQFNSCRIQNSESLSAVLTVRPRFTTVDTIPHGLTEI